MKVWWVLAWYNYYPHADNYQESFDTEEEADTYALAIDKNFDEVEVINISDRLGLVPEESGSWL